MGGKVHVHSSPLGVSAGAKWPADHNTVLYESDGADGDKKGYPSTAMVSQVGKRGRNSAYRNEQRLSRARVLLYHNGAPRGVEKGSIDASLL